MSINRNNLSTSADGADIFVVAGPGESFTNLGNLMTSGHLASGIRGAADGITITSKGMLTTSGDGSPGIIVGDLLGAHFNDVTVTNYGAITVTGGILDDGVNLAFPDGIDVFGNKNIGKNYGTITIADPDGAGMFSIGIGCLLANYGKIETAGIGMAIDGIDGTEIGNTLINYGQIHVTGGDRYGMLANTTSENVVKNYGTIQVDGGAGPNEFSFGIGLLGAENHGENFGTIIATGVQDRGVLLEGEGHTFVNYGTIQTTGEDSVGARFSGYDLPGTDGGTITNYGKIVSAAWSVKGALADDRFVNYGSLVGDVYMGAGDDTYVAAKGGSLSGTLTLADGNDLIVFEKGGGKLVVTDFVAGAGTDDVIDLSAFAFSFDQIIAKASQSGPDVILKLGDKDQIVLENVSIDSLSSDDFTFASAALQQAMAPAHVPHADYLLG
jgi:hypothetical protein